jgi:hypothetical protein
MKGRNYSAVRRGAVFIVSAILLAACATATDPDVAPPTQNVQTSGPPSSNWVIRLPSEDLVDFRGVADFDNAGIGTAQVLYPAPNIIGFAIALVAHGVISGSTQSAQRNRIRTQADSVLTPYQPFLGAFKNRELFEQALRHVAMPQQGQVIEPSATIANVRLILNATPVFSMTQDQVALVLNTDVQVLSTKDPATPIYSNTIKVVSTPIASSEPAGYWSANSGEALKGQSSKLLANAIDLALNQVDRESKVEGVQKTFRYVEGKVERMERGELLNESCDRLVVKTLRGWLLSIPLKRDGQTGAGNTACNSASPNSG